MKKYLKHIKVVLFVGVLAFLFGFTSLRNSRKKIKDVDVEFLNGDNLYITYETVNKLLIQNYQNIKSQPKETIILSRLESVLQSNEMIDDADVYVTVDGVLCASVKQREPIARVNDEGVAYYIDYKGLKMPLSSNYSARVPMLTGVKGKDISKAYALAKYIYNDSFLRQQIIGITQNADDKFTLETRVGGQQILLGSLNKMNNKFHKLKAFYQKNLKDKTLNQYRTINLIFDNQVVCTKK